MIRKRDLLAYCDQLAEDVEMLEVMVYHLQAEVAGFYQKKNIDCVKRPMKKK